MRILMYILAIFLPPLAVILATGSVGKTILTIVLMLIGWLPGVIHALIVVAGSSSHAGGVSMAT